MLFTHDVKRFTQAGNTGQEMTIAIASFSSSCIFGVKIMKSVKW